MAGLIEMDEEPDASLGMAVIGMAARFPGADDIDQFWENLRDGKESIHFFTPEELKTAGVTQVELDDPHYVKAAPLLKGIDFFDAAFFDYTPIEANLMDPQQRLLLECAWQALEHAGYAGEHTLGTTGIFVGAKLNTYMVNFLVDREFMASPQNRLQVMLGNADFGLATRIAYKLNLTGPCYMLQTACSTSLAAIHLACQSLMLDECRMALAGGVAIEVPHSVGYWYQYGGLTSPDGHCRSFDAKAQGSVFGSGVGVVVLKRLDDALADGDTIYAVVKGTAVNNDGALKASFTAPSVIGQKGVIQEALACSGVEVDSISYMEAHGSATPLGDPIEVTALTNAFRAGTNQKAFCRLGAVKSNIGHLDAAAGVASFIKTVQALRHKLIPPSLHFEQPNPEIDFANSPFFVNTELTEWKTNGIPRRAGINSLGFGGTNVHAILEEAPPVTPSGPARPWHLLTLSAKTEAALNTATTNLAEYLKRQTDTNLADVAYTLQLGRQSFKYRRMVVSCDSQDAVAALQAPDRTLTGVQDMTGRPVAFMFTGAGDQYANMTLELYRTEPTFRTEIDRCAEFLNPLLGFDLRSVIYPDKDQKTVQAHTTPPLNLDLQKILRPEAPPDEATKKLSQTAVLQPALFVVEYALARLLMDWGIQPQAMIGYSTGEYVAACLAGVFSLEDALTVVARRAQLIATLPHGALLAVMLSEQEVQPCLGQHLAVSAINAPAMCIVGGSEEAITEVEQRLATQRIACRRIQTLHAFHSTMMEPILAKFAACFKGITLKPPSLSFVSNVTGTWIKPTEATDPAYWVKHLRQTVRFAEGVQTLLVEPERILLEVGPGRTLCTLAAQLLPQGSSVIVQPTVHPRQQQESDVAFLLTAVGQLWLAGQHIDWPQLYAHERRHRLPLPTYPFERQRYWVDAKLTTGNDVPGNTVDKKPDIADWFYVPVWKQALPSSMPPQAATLASSESMAAKTCWLIFSDSYGLGIQLAQRLRQQGQQVVMITAGAQFARLEDAAYTLDPQQPADYDALLKALHESDRTPHKIVHLWSIISREPTWSPLEFAEKCDALGFSSLLFLTQALGRQPSGNTFHIEVVFNNGLEVTGEKTSYPEKATLLGLCRVIPQEYPNITCRGIDLDWPQPSLSPIENGIEQLAIELATQPTDRVIVFRNNQRWVQTFDKVRLDSADRSLSRLRQGGTYLITGGLGGVGLAIARHLAQTVQARLVLTGRSSFPDRAEWNQWLATHPNQDAVSNKIRSIQALEELGAQVVVAQADVTDEAQMRAVSLAACRQFGTIHGVIQAAGVPGGGVIQIKTPQMAAQVMAPKVKGTLVLEEVFKAVELDFLVLFSSLSAFRSELGQADYCAANAFLDAFARHNTLRHNRLTIAINWGMWREVGMAVNTLSTLPEAFRTWQEKQLETAMLPTEGAEAFDRILCRARTWINSLPQVIVSSIDLQTAIEQVEALTQSQIMNQLGQLPRLPGTTRPRPNLKTPYVAPRTTAEDILVGMWQRVLGVTPIGVDDNFFDLGGHSLLIMQLINEVYQTFKVELAIQSLFDRATVAGMAQLIDTTGQQPPAVDVTPLAERLRTAFPTERARLLEDYLKQRAAYSLNIPADQLPQDGSLESFNLELLALDLMQSLKKDLQLQLYTHEIMARPLIQELAHFILTERERLFKLATLTTRKPLSAYPLKPSGRRDRVNRLACQPARKNRRMLFLHSSPRAGSTLLRVMLAGHPGIFCPPELSILFYQDMEEWRQGVSLSGQNFREQWPARGLHSAFVELLGLGQHEGWNLLDDLVARNLPIQDVYGRLQQLAGDRLLIDKTPPYSLDLETLGRAEALFEAPQYIFLVRHPYAVIDSLLRIRADRLFCARLFEDDDVEPYVVAEAIWSLCNRNLLQFFESIEPQRYRLIYYEELVSEPEKVMSDLCQFLGVPFYETLLNPYDGKRERMTGGLGDPNFFQHDRIDTRLGEAWKKVKLPRRLDEATRQLAAQLGYELPEGSEPPAWSPAEQERLWTNLTELSDGEVTAMLDKLLVKER